MPGVDYDHSMFGAQMHFFGRCPAVAWIREDVQPTVPFLLHIRAQLGATDKMTERYAKLARQHIARTGSTAREIWKLMEPGTCDKANIG